MVWDGGVVPLCFNNYYNKTVPRIKCKQRKVKESVVIFVIHQKLETSNNVIICLDVKQIRQLLMFLIFIDLDFIASLKLEKRKTFAIY